MTAAVLAEAARDYCQRARARDAAGQAMLAERDWSAADALARAADALARIPGDGPPSVPPPGSDQRAIGTIVGVHAPRGDEVVLMFDGGAIRLGAAEADAIRAAIDEALAARALARDLSADIREVGR